jgi:hypothetical protein
MYRFLTGLKYLKINQEFTFYIISAVAMRLVISIPFLLPAPAQPGITRLFGITIPVYYTQHGTYFAWLLEIFDEESRYGIFKVWTPYPPLYSFLLYSLFKFAGSVNTQWTSWYLVNALSDFGTAILVWKLIYNTHGKTLHFNKIAPLAYLYSISPLPIFFTVTASVYDPTVVFLCILSLYLANKKAILSSLAAAFGASLKLFPILLFPAYLLSRDRHGKLRFAVSFVLFLLCFNLPLYFVNPSNFMSPFFWQAGRPPWSSVYALVLGGFGRTYLVRSPLYADLSPPVPPVNWDYYLVGIVPSPQVFVNPIGPQDTGLYNRLAEIVVGVALGGSALVSIKRRLDLTSLFVALLSATFITSSGWSPEFFLYLLPFIPLILKPERAFYVCLVMQFLLLIEFPVSVYLVPAPFNTRVFWVTVLIQDLFLAYLWLAPLAGARGSRSIRRIREIVVRFFVLVR